MLNFSDLQVECKRRAQKDSGGAQFDTAIKNIVNTSLFRVGREALWRSLRRKSAFSTVVGQEEYNLPIQVGHRMFMWHEEWGYTFQMAFLPDQDFYSASVTRTESSVPYCYRMWGEDMVITQPTSASAVTVVSSSTSDTSTISVTIFGTVNGYPDFETINLDGTTPVVGTKLFSRIERCPKSASTVGRVTLTTNSGAVTVAVLPVGDTTAGIMYKKVQLFPLPSTVFTMNVQSYKEPYRLVNDNDIHELGQDFDESIILLSTAKLKAENNQKEASMFYELYQDEIRSLKRTNVDKIDWFIKRNPPISGGARGQVHPFLNANQAGGYYGTRSF